MHFLTRIQQSISMTLHISEAEVRQVLDMTQALGAVEEISRKEANEEVVVHPRRRFELLHGGFFHYMAASDYAAGFVAMKQYTYVRGKVRFLVPLYEMATGDLLAEYARFRAGTNADGVRYHRYVQQLMQRQLADTAGEARLFLDLPLGVHPEGFDTHRFRESFAIGVSGGAPPDTFFTAGQDWGFPPLHPVRIRENEYRYPIACLRHLMRHTRGNQLRAARILGVTRNKLRNKLRSLGLPTEHAKWKELDQMHPAVGSK